MCTPGPPMTEMGLMALLGNASAVDSIESPVTTQGTHKPSITPDAGEDAFDSELRSGQ